MDCPQCKKGNMIWVKSSWLCPRCHYKEPCCQGEAIDD